MHFLLPFLQLSITLIIYLKNIIHWTIRKECSVCCMPLFLFSSIFGCFCLCLFRRYVYVFPKINWLGFILFSKQFPSRDAYVWSPMFLSASFFLQLYLFFLVSLVNTKNLYHSFHYTHEHIIVGSCFYIYSMRMKRQSNKCMENKDGSCHAANKQNWNKNC